MERKKIILGLSIAFLLLSVLFLIWVLFNPSKPIEKDNLISPQALPKLEFPSPPLWITNAPSYNVSASNQVYPDKFASIKLNTVDGLLVGQRVASSFNFKSTPQNIKTQKESFYIWESQGATFTLKDSPPTVSYNSSFVTLTSSIVQSDEDYITKTQELFNRLGFFPTFVSLSTPEIIYLNAPNTATEAQIVEKSKATIINLSYQLLINGVTFFNLSPRIKDFIVSYDGDGNLLSFSVNLFSFQKENLFIPVVSFDKAKEKLINQQGALAYAISPTDEYIFGTITYNIPVINISSVVLGYAPDLSKTQLLPVFVFSGTAVSIVDNKEVNTVTFVSGLP